MQTAVAETTEFFRVNASLKLNPKKRAVLGQYMTSATIGHFMASLFCDASNEVRLLNAGAGVGSLTATFVEMLCRRSKKPQSVSLICYEIKSMLLDYLSSTLAEAEAQCAGAEIAASSEIRTDDFILSHSDDYQADIFRGQKATKDEFTHVIMNTPYKKLTQGRDIVRPYEKRELKHQIYTQDLCSLRRSICRMVKRWWQSCLDHSAMGRISSPLENNFSR